MRAWGKDVVAAGGTGDVPVAPVVVNERQSVSVLGPFDAGCFCFGPVTGGSFTIGFDGQTTGPIAFDATAGQVESALEALANIDSVSVSGGPGPGVAWEVEFAGSLGGTDVAEMSVDGAGLSPAESFGSAVTLEGGSTTLTGPGEVCTVASECQAGKTGDGQGEFSLAGSPQVAVDQSDGSVYVADSGNDRVQKFTASGVFVDEFGSTGSGDGELSGPMGVGVDPVSGDVYVADTNNNRVQRFDDTGSFVDEIGTTAGGSGNGELISPSRVAVDSTGRLYVLDSGNGRVQRFDSSGGFDQVFAQGAYSSPSDLAVDPASDNVLIAGSSADFSVSGILEFDSSGAAVDVHAANLGVTAGGIAARASTGRVFVSDSSNDRVMILGQVTPPTAAIEPVGAIGTDGATFNGLVNPQGPTDTGYRFEYSTDGNTWTCAPDPSCDLAADVNVGSGTGDVAVSQTVSGLEVSTEYRVRVVATKTFNGGTATSGETTFTTGAVAPVVRAVRAGRGSDTAVWIGGEVNPRNSPTSAYVEYTLDTDTAFADSSRVPVAPDTIDAGDGNAFVKVDRLATGLQPNTTYRYRVVAANDGGQTVGPARTFTTTSPLPEPPANRGYEMVSPLDKGGADIERNVYSGGQATSGAAALGDKVAFAALGRFAGIPSGTPLGQYVSVRDEDAQRWTTRGITPPTTLQPNTTTNGGEVSFLSEDLSRAIVGTTFPLAEGASLLGARHGLYRQDLTGAALSYDLLSRPVAQLPPFHVGDRWFDFVGASKDVRHVVFDSPIQLTADGPADGPRAVYEWVDGQTRLASVLPSGDPAGSATAGANPPSAIGTVHVGDHPVSDDGQRVFFTVDTEPSGLGSLYVREGGQSTRLVSSSQRDGDDPSTPRQATFRAARAGDGGLALFTSEQKLTEDATATTDGGGSPDLYLWDADAPEDPLTDLTTADPDGGGVLNVVRAADDLSHVYFVATGDLADGAVRGLPNLYAWTRESGVRHVAVLDPQRDARLWGVKRVYSFDQFRSARVDGDGSRLVFESHAAPTADGTGQTRQIYLYDYDTDRLSCVSCPQGDTPAGGDSWLFFPPDLGPGAIVAPQMPYRLSRNISADGKRVFFETAQRLVVGDVNGQPDVYMWSGGQLSLISTGKGGEKSEFIDASASGDDVFFLTRERLVGADTDNQIDIYDARVGGGFPEPVQPPKCIGDECRPPATSPPSLPDPGTHAEGTGDVAPSGRGSVSVGGLSVAQRRALGAGRRVSLVVGVNKPGRVTVRGVARVGKRLRVVARAGRSVGGAGRVRIGVRLSRPGRVQLKTAGRLRVTLRVRFAGVVEERVVSLVAPSAARTGGRR